jgi:chromosome segregation ATPase
MWKKGLFAVGAVAAGVGGATYVKSTIKHNKLESYRQKYVLNDGYSLLGTRWHTSNYSLKDYTQRMTATREQQDVVLAQMAPFQQQLVKLKDDEKQLKVGIDGASHGVRTVKEEAASLQESEDLWKEDQRKVIKEQAKAKLDKLNKVAYVDYQEKCGLNADSVDKDTVVELDIIENTHKAKDFLSQMESSVSEPKSPKTPSV